MNTLKNRENRLDFKEQHMSFLVRYSQTQTLLQLSPFLMGKTKTMAH